MNYSQSLHYLNSFLNYERIIFDSKNRLWNLTRMRTLLDWLGHPEKSFFPVLIAGTKGKGSTGFFLESLLQVSGVSVGFYSSPHLEEPLERIRMGGRCVSKQMWAKGVTQIARILKRKQLPDPLGAFTYFEITTFLAIWLFHQCKIQVGIFEVGMGGRLDATNVLRAPAVMMAPIAFDHEAILGNRLRDIAREKAAVIHQNADVVVSPQPEEVMKVIRTRVRSKRARLHGARFPRNLSLALKGDFQRINAGAAVAMAKILSKKYGFGKVEEVLMRKSFKRKSWPGRMELFTGNPDFLLDGAHNPASVEALVTNLQDLYPDRKRLLVFGTSRDKKTSLMFKTLSQYFDEAVLVPIPSPRSQRLSILLEQGRSSFQRLYPVENVAAVLKLIHKIVEKDTLVVVTGSFYLIGEMRKQLRKK